MGIAEHAGAAPAPHSPARLSPGGHPSLLLIYDHQDLRGDFTNSSALMIYLKPHTGEENITKKPPATHELYRKATTKS